MFHFMGRMTVKPGAVPVWEGEEKNKPRRGLSRMFNRGLRNYGNRFMNDYNNTFLDRESKENIDIRKHIEIMLVNKFEKLERYTKEEKKGVEMTIRAQARLHSKVILDEAITRIKDDENLEKELEELSEEEAMKVYYEEIENEVNHIINEEFEFQPDLDIKSFIEREKKVKEKVSKGEITEEEAYSILKEPIESREGKKATQEYEERCEEYRKQEESKNDRSKEYRKSQYVPPEKRKPMKKDQKETETSKKEMELE